MKFFTALYICRFYDFATQANAHAPFTAWRGLGEGSPGCLVASALLLATSKSSCRNALDWRRPAAAATCSSWIALTVAVEALLAFKSET